MTEEREEEGILFSWEDLSLFGMFISILSLVIGS